MNIKITHNWLLEYLDTDATPNEIRDYLSLCGPSIESVNKVGDDYVYDIEIISNRIDYASVLGIAQEAVAILPMFGKKAKLKTNPLVKYKFNQIFSSSSPIPPQDFLKVKILNPDLCSRFTAVVIDNIKIGPSPKFITERLVASGIKSINNVVDISNYLMLALGQPVHTFDFNKIKDGVMTMRESKKGEKIITLDDKEVTLPGGDIVIENGTGTIIDLCGVMGGANSAISNSTRRVLLFVQTYNKEKIRKTVMTTGVRTVAATYFEKGLDEERVEATTAYGVELLQKYAGGKIASNIYDIYPAPFKGKKLVMKYDLFDKLIGIKIDRKKINQILESLGFKINYLLHDRENVISVEAPSYRIPEDLVEEVARIYGYHNIPSVLQPSVFVDQPKDMEDLFVFQNKTKLFLKHLGLNEVINYSMISKNLILDSGLKIEDHLRLSNSISTDIEFLRISLLPSLYKNIKDNSGRKEILKFFEIAKVYLPKKGDLPDEIYRLGIAVSTDYLDLKGIVEGLCRELNISKSIFDKDSIQEKDGIYMIEIDLKLFIENSRVVPDYIHIHPYAVIKLDKTFDLSPRLTYEVILKVAQQSKLLQNIEVLTLYKNRLTLRFYYSSPERNITEEEAKKELEKLN